MDLVPNAVPLLVHTMAWAADQVVSVKFVDPKGVELPEWTFGSHIDLVLAPRLIRQYSLCGEPSDRRSWTIAVLRERDGTGGSRYVHETLRPGMLTSAIGPKNNYPLVSSPRYLFIAGGIGITPLLPMVRYLAQQAVQWGLLYGGRRHASMAFTEELATLGPGVSVVPEDEFGLLDVEQAIGATSQDTAVYCCGPEPLIAAVERTCEQMCRPAPFIERFNGTPEAKALLETSVDATFEIVLATTGRRLTVPAGKSIIQVLDEAGVWVPTSCTEGYCGTCETEVISGIPEHRDTFLAPEHRATNKTMMICVGRSKSPELVLKI